MDTHPHDASQIPTPAGHSPARIDLAELVTDLSLISRGDGINFKQTQKKVREILSDFYDAKLRIVQRVLSDFPKLKRLIVEPRLEGFVYFPDSFVSAVNRWLGPGRLMIVGTGRRGEGDLWMWDLRGRRRIVSYEA